MIESIVEIESGQYPFDEICGQGRSVRVQEMQTFTNQQELREKKNELVKKNKLIDSPYIIKLLKIYQQDLTLYYVFEYVPYSFQNYINKFYKSGKQQIVEMSSKLFLKKITNELTVLISYLISMRIEIDLSLSLLGLTKDEKVKLFMGPRCKMGHKTELTLIPYYNTRKEKIISFLEEELTRSKEENFKERFNKLILSDAELNESIYQDTVEPTESANNSFNLDSSMFSNSRKQSTNSCMNSPQSKPSFNFRNTSHNFGARFQKKEPRKSVFSVDKGAKYHKNSFQFGATRPQQNTAYSYDDDKEDSKSYTHSRSIRIELQQNIDPSKRKNRKDSYKVKVTTFHEYEMDDCNPSDLLGNMPKNEADIANFFSKQSPSKSERFRKRSTDDKFENFFQPKTSTTPKHAFVRKESLPEQGYRLSTATTAHTLEEKVRMAKQKAEIVLNRYLTSKKKTVSLNQDLASGQQ